MVRTAVLVALTLAGGCDLVDKVAGITFCNGEEQVELDLTPLAALTSGLELPPVPCGAQDDCSGAEALLDCSGQSFSCALRCLGPLDGQVGMCGVELSATVEQSTQLDLSNEVNRKIQGSKLVDVTVSRFEYSVLANSLTVDIPQTELMIGPQSASTTSDADVVPLATLPTIAAGATPTDQTVTTDTAGREALAGFARNYDTPFRVFGKTTIKVSSGDALPSGKLNLTVKACFKATPG